ncbi:organic solute transporter alpha-like protein [Bicyclus anynana]|uniref:Organic solute transporter alpha-like protein n=1 Tax=Bicyclus anynana TaxID=110368 RepID=A0ABM3LS88_BICAN|nr:organic solute transporter alpha-like protein [Bicyclus anynana]
MDLLSAASNGVAAARHLSSVPPELNNAVNTTLLCHSYSLQPDFASYFAVLKGNAWAIWSCGLLVLLTLCILYAVTLRSALKYWKDSRTSVAIVLAVYPVVAAAALLATVLPRVRVLSEAVAQEAVMVAMYHFYCLIIAECGGTTQLIRRSEGSHMETRVLPCCCWPCCILPRPRVQKKSLTWLRYLVLQMPVIQAILYLIVLVLWAEDMMLYLNSFIYIQPFIAASILSGVWGIIMCVRVAESTGAKPRPRFLAIQLALVIVKLQCGFAKVLPDVATLPCIMALHPSVYVNLIHNIVMILEMLLLSILAWRLYRVPPGKDAEKVQHVVIAVLEDSLSSLEKISDIGSHKTYSNKNDIKRDD